MKFTFEWIRNLSLGLICEKDSDCDTENCFYCLSNGTCSQYDSEYCDTSICGNGDGDCDPETCPIDLTCGMNNFLDYHPDLANCDGTEGAEVCFHKGKKLKCIWNY